MSTVSLLGVPHERPSVSFELYPARSQKGEVTLRRTVARLAAAEPDFFSITDGASGSKRDASRDLILRILRDTEVTPIAHLTCVGTTSDELRTVITDLLDEGVRDFLALRGDPPQGEAQWQPTPGGLNYASDLVGFLREIEAEHFGPPDETAATRRGPLSISVAAYPGGVKDPSGAPVVNANDVQSLIRKQESGADYAITQLFYDVEHYLALVEQARAAGVHIPLLPGVIPLTDPRRLRRLEELTGVAPPAQLLRHLESAPDADSAYRLGLDVTRGLVQDILDAGAPGLHIYTFNKAEPALDLLHTTGLRPAPSLT